MMTPMLIAIKKDQLVLVEKMLEVGYKINFQFKICSNECIYCVRVIVIFVSKSF
mgnify:CR=1 FL=1